MSRRSASSGRCRWLGIEKGLRWPPITYSPASIGKGSLRHISSTGRTAQQTTSIVASAPPAWVIVGWKLDRGWLGGPREEVDAGVRGDPASQVSARRSATASAG
jgi:hypothetical protein